ncbi:hypothetical protein NPIL_588081 [Nephila pilipes]|uniref:Uncharacterized protein n=1 Tax=Nephila pilipes TaxID=299642 RepID=A0A8X6R017_NEPPI|nr:hypothetical protein NPIL_588081 [Nephila pilipes]
MNEKKNRKLDKFVANYRREKEEERKRTASETKEKAENENNDDKFQLIVICVSVIHSSSYIDESSVKPLRLRNNCRHSRRAMIKRRRRSNRTDQECSDDNELVEDRTSQRRKDELADGRKETLEV